jgi:hypothetical protein
MPAALQRLGHPHRIDRINGLVGAEHDHVLDVTGQGRPHDVMSSVLF